MTILKFTRAEVYAFAQQGIMNITALKHWDVCSALSEGKRAEDIAESFRISDRHVYQIRDCKCPQN